MTARFYVTFEADWTKALMALWAHCFRQGSSVLNWQIPAREIPHRGFPVLHFEFEGVDLVFGSPRQHAHRIDILSKNCPNGHWLSRLPAALK